MFDFFDKDQVDKNRELLKDFLFLPSSLENACELLEQFSKIMGKDGIDPQADVDSYIFKLLGSKELKTIAMKCLNQSRYKDTRKITFDMFEEESMRPLYIPVLANSLKVNLSPFLSGVLTLLPANSEKIVTDILKQKQTMGLETTPSS